MQSQQARITTTLTVTGFMLAFLVYAAFNTTTAPHWTNKLLVISLIAFAVAVLAGLVALFPRIPIQDQLFINALWLQTIAYVLPEECLMNALRSSFDTRRHKRTMALRRWCLRIQIVSLTFAVVFLLWATSGRLLAQ